MIEHNLSGRVEGSGAGVRMRTFAWRSPERGRWPVRSGTARRWSPSLDTGCSRTRGSWRIWSPWTGRGPVSRRSPWGGEGTEERGEWYVMPINAKSLIIAHRLTMSLWQQLWAWRQQARLGNMLWRTTAGRTMLWSLLSLEKKSLISVVQWGRLNKPYHSSDQRKICGVHKSSFVCPAREQSFLLKTWLMTYMSSKVTD